MSVPVASETPTPTRGESRYHAIAAFFDAFAAVDARWRRRNRTYHRLIEALHRALIPPRQSVLEIGSGTGNLLAALEPSRGLGIDVSPGMVEAARELHPQLEFAVASGEELVADETFDYIVMSDLVPYVEDLLGLFQNAARHSHPATRIVVQSYSQVWKPVLRLAELLRLKPRKPVVNWVSPDDVRHLLALADLEQVTLSRRILMPKRVPVLSWFANAILANIWPLNHLCLTYWIVARPRPKPRRGETGVTVVCPCRNEAGMIAEIIERTPEMGTGTELIFVEGNSTDGTREEIDRQIALNPHRTIRVFEQHGRGKGDAVRLGLANASNEILMILDADLTVRPEELPRFYDALMDGRGELVNGSRLVYGLEPGSMRFLNMLGNKLFSAVYSRLLGQSVKDTLCGTKTLTRHDYARIAAGREFFGDFDPFGDFDLLLGAARLNLKIVDLPVRYGARTYGETKISRFRHGWLLVRMSFFAFRKLRVAALHPPPTS